MRNNEIIINQRMSVRETRRTSRKDSYEPACLSIKYLEARVSRSNRLEMPITGIALVRDILSNIFSIFILSLL